MIVIDASVLTNALTGDGGLGATARSKLARDPVWVAPEHLIVEVVSAVRGQYLGARISRVRAEDALAALGAFTLDVVRTALLLTRMWELRDTLTAYDAAYVALAEACACPLVTADVRLARSAGPRCEIRLALPTG